MKKRGRVASCLGWFLGAGVLLFFGYVFLDNGGEDLASNLFETLSDNGHHAGSSFNSNQSSSQPRSKVTSKGNGNSSSSSGRKPTAVELTPISFERKVYHPLNNCAHSRLHVGDSVVVSFGGGRNAIRTAPDTHPADNIIYHAPSGEGMQIIGGPVCNYGWILWKVHTDSGYLGWTPESKGDEFWLTPIESFGNVKSNPKTYELYQKVNSTLHDSHLSEAQKKQKMHIYQQTYGQEMVTTVLRYVPVYQENGTFTSFDNWSRGLSKDINSSSDKSPISKDPVGATMSLYFDSSASNIKKQLGLGD